MKLKCCPSDFQVDEQSSFSLERGEYAVYCLTKQSLGTVEAIEAICSRWKLPRERLSYGGLKDRHAITRQFVTILRGPHRDLQQSSFSLQYLGQSAQPFTPLDIEGNRFRIVLRDLLVTEAERLSHEWQLTLQHGVPNYFDDQRFGSLGKSGEFVAAPWCQGKYDRALWLALAEENDHDRPDDQRNKQILRDFWGNWSQCAKRMSPCLTLGVVKYLDQFPGRFKEAFARIRVDLRGLYLSAFQSDLWNETLARILKTQLPKGDFWEVELGARRLPFFSRITATNSTILDCLPLPSARLHLEPGPLLDLYQSVCQSRGLELRELRVKYPRDSFFSKGDRPTTFVPLDATWEVIDDELYPGKKAAIVVMSLPRGSYATIVVKRLTSVLAISNDSYSFEAE